MIVCEEVIMVKPVGSADTHTDKCLGVMQLLHVTWCEPGLKGYCSDLVMRTSECGVRGIITFNQKS